MWRPFLSSLSVAIAAFLLPGVVEFIMLVTRSTWSTAWSAASGAAVDASLVLGVFWPGMVATAIAKQGRAALVMLIGAPLVLFWPLFYLSMSGCTADCL